PDALVPQSNFSPDQIIVDLGGNSLSALGNASQEVPNPALELIFSTAIGNFDLTTFLQATQEIRLSDLQAEPTITTLDNRPAEISSVQPASVDIGFTFQTQQADNQILVNDGETAVVGGLTVTSVNVVKTGIPFLVDLPIVGKLFGFTHQQEQRRDLLILVTP